MISWGHWFIRFGRCRHSKFWSASLAFHSTILKECSNDICLFTFPLAWWGASLRGKHQCYSGMNFRLCWYFSIKSIFKTASKLSGKNKSHRVFFGYVLALINTCLVEINSLWVFIKVRINCTKNWWESGEVGKWSVKVNPCASSPIWLGLLRDWLFDCLFLILFHFV